MLIALVTGGRGIVSVLESQVSPLCHFLHVNSPLTTFIMMISILLPPPVCTTCLEVVGMLVDNLDFRRLGHDTKHGLSDVFHAPVVATSLADHYRLLIGTGWLVWLDSNGLLGLERRSPQPDS